MFVCDLRSPAFDVVTQAFLLFTGHDDFVWPELPWLVVFLGLGDDDVSFAEVDIVNALYDEFTWSPSYVEAVGEDVRDECVFVVVV